MRLVARCSIGFCLALSSVATMPCQQPAESGLLERVGAWLPSDIEAVYASNVPLRGIAGSAGESTLLAYARLAESATAAAVSDSNLAAASADFTATRALFVGRRFRTLDTPGGLGLKGNLEGCSFLQSSASAVDGLLRHLSQTRAKIVKEGLPYELVDSPGKPSSLVFSAPEQDLLMVCSSQSLADEVLAGRNSGGSRFELSPPVSRNLNMGARVWGYRQFRREKMDPTSPLTAARSILPGYRDIKAVAMTFAMDTASSARGVYLTAARNRKVSDYRSFWKTEVRLAENLGLTTVTIQFDPSADPTGEMLGRVMLTLLGLLVIV